MRSRLTFILIGIVFLIALAVYMFTTPRGGDIPLTGIVDGNEVIVSPQITGRMVRLDVDEGSQVKKGDLIAELDPKELEASLAAAKANIDMLAASVAEAQHNVTWTNDQTNAALNQAGAIVTSTGAQVEQAKANVWRDQMDYDRAKMLAEKGELSAQDRDHAEANLRISEANLKALEDNEKAQQAALGVAKANLKQIDIRKSALSTTVAQLEQARANAAEIETQLGYTKIHAPIDGMVSVRVAKQGEVVAQGAPIVVVVDIDHLWVRADVEESYIDSLQFGQILRVRLPSGRIIEGPVFFKGVESDFATQRDVSRTKRDIKTFAIKVSVPNADHRLFTGMTATVLLSPLGREREAVHADSPTR
jgi:HlyD family secretion protein